MACENVGGKKKQQQKDDDGIRGNESEMQQIEVGFWKGNKI